MPPPANPTAQEEEDFMHTLFKQLDNTYSNTVTSSFGANSANDGTQHDAIPVHNASPSDFVSESESTATQKLIDDAPRESSNTPLGELVFNRLVDVGDIDMKALCDGAEDWDWKDMDLDHDINVKASKTIPACSEPLPRHSRENCSRCEVLQVTTLNLSEKRLLVKVDLESGSERREVILKQDWVYTDVIAGDIINVIGEFTPFSGACSSIANPASTITVTSTSNMLIVHPDLLLSVTTIANAPSCPRKPLISLMLSSNAPSPPLITPEPSPVRSSPGEAVVWGNFLHEVMQMSLAAGSWDRKLVEDRIDKVVGSPMGLGELVKLGVGIEKAKFEVTARAGGLHEFAKRFIGPDIKPEGKLTDIREACNSISRIALTTLHDVEEEIWSPTYGIKGKIDASLQALIQQDTDVHSTKVGHPANAHSYTLPFEIKTGRAVGVLEHRAQTMLYTVLMAERYGVEVSSGLLYYTQAEELMRVSTAKNELKGLLMARNELASHLMRKRVSELDGSGSANATGRPILPPTLDDDYKCAKCYVVNGCMLYRKAVEGIKDDTSPIAGLYEKKTSHLTHAQCEFFKKWEALVSMEEQDVVRFRKELWTLTAEERERKGRCFAEMVIDGYTHDDGPGVARTQEHVCRFVRASGASQVLAANFRDGSTSLLNGSISAGDAVTVSVEPDLFALARGFVIELGPDHITVGFDHHVDLDVILRRTRQKTANVNSGKVICRLDKDEFSSGLGRIRDNLARLFYVNGDTRRLSLVVDLAAPRFDDVLLEDSELSSCLNSNQRDAVRKVLSAKDYAIVLGMPGTGKTTTIAEIINVLVKRGKTVLLASYTHSAVDTILLKLSNADYPILRLGSLDKLHPGVLKHTLAHQPHPTTIEQLEHQILAPPVVATTCLSVDHPLFARRYFDVCIIDEASQVTLPTCLGPLRYADKFVLVGDHFQLPPLVRSRHARAGGLDVSLFKRLAEAHPEAVVNLVHQYRMNEDIMLLSNKLIYGDRLRCGSKSVAESSLVLPNRLSLGAVHVDSCQVSGCWLDQLLDENCKAVFVDTDEVPGKESCVGDLIQNEVEAKLVYQVTEALLLCGVTQNQIGIISLYRQQIKLLSQYLHHHKEIELLTADRSQGRDKDCIIISLVKSNTSGQTGELLKDWRRINVSFTRARSKLIIFGSRKTLRAAPLLGNFFDLMETRGWILSLKRGADAIHEQKRPTHGLVAQSKRRTMENDDENIANKENVGHGCGTPRKMKKVKIDEGILRGRHMLRDVINNVS